MIHIIKHLAVCDSMALIIKPTIMAKAGTYQPKSLVIKSEESLKECVIVCYEALETPEMIPFKQTKIIIESLIEIDYLK